MSQLNLSQIKENQKAILFALKNGQVCPFCKSGFELVGADENGEIYVHNCGCLLGLELAEYSLTLDSYIDDDIFDPDEHSSQNTLQISTSKNEYLKFCHHCKQPGVDSNDPNCIEDPPYQYRCRFCNHSLRTHYEFGEGLPFDLAKLNITWGFLQGGGKAQFNWANPNQ